MHRTYEMSNAPVRVTWLSDRVEIMSPGGNKGGVGKTSLACHLAWMLAERA